MHVRRFGKTPKPGQVYRRRPGAYAILPLGAQILLTHQNGLEPEFQLPGGGIDPGESAIAALHREVFEETGWRIGNIRRLGVFKRFAYMPEYDLWAEKICHIFVARPTSRLGPPPESEHIAVHVEPSLAMDLLANPGDVHFLDRFLRSLR